MTGLKDLFNVMVGRGNEIARANADEPVETVSSTVRFGGDLKRWLDAQAEALGGISTQSVITSILNGVMYETLDPASKDRVSVVSTRIIKLFDLHKIDMVTAAEILGVPFSDMTPDRLVNHVNNTLIDKLCETFSFSRGWLLGEVDYFGTNELSWDRSPATAARHILQRAREGLMPRVMFLKDASWDLDKGRHSNGNGMRMPVILELTRTIGKRTYKTYERLESLPWEYDRCRVDILTLVMFCEKMGSNEHAAVAREMGLPSNHFLPHSSGFSWASSTVDHDVFERFTQGLIPVAQVMLPRIWYTFTIEAYVDSPEKYPESAKTDSREFASIKEKCEKTIKGIAESITHNKEFAEKQKEWMKHPAGDDENEPVEKAE